MKNFRFILLPIVIVSLVSFCFAQKSGELDTFGYYYIVKPNKAFADISEIHLAGDYGQTQTPVFFGLIRLKNKRAKDFRLLKPFQKGNYISFTTSAVNRISYKFTGYFAPSFKEDLRSAIKPRTIVLEGKLLKYRGKVKIAEQLVKFTYFAGD